MTTILPMHAEPRNPFPDVSAALTAYDALEREDSLMEDAIARTAHRCLCERRHESVDFDALGPVAQTQYRAAAGLMLRWLDPAWKTMATDIAIETFLEQVTVVAPVANTEAQREDCRAGVGAIVNRWLYVLLGLWPLSNGQRVELVRDRWSREAAIDPPASGVSS